MLQKDLLSAAFFAICAEFRHIFDSNGAEDVLKFATANGMEDFMREYAVVYDILQGSKANYFKYDAVKLKERFKEDTRNYQVSYRAVLIALHKAGQTRGDFVAFAEKCYRQLRWHTSFGGDPWAGICKGWLRLSSASFKKDGDGRDLSVWIDHVYSLQHNTDTVFNKLKAYYKNYGYDWIKKALDFKKNAEHPYELIMKGGTSPDLNRYAQYLFKKYQNMTLEDAMRKANPPSPKDWGKQLEDEINKGKVVTKAVNDILGSLAAGTKKAKSDKTKYWVFWTNNNNKLQQGSLMELHDACNISLEEVHKLVDDPGWGGWNIPDEKGRFYAYFNQLEGAAKFIEMLKVSLKGIGKVISFPISADWNETVANIKKDNIKHLESLVDNNDGIQQVIVNHPSDQKSKANYLNFCVYMTVRDVTKFLEWITERKYVWEVATFSKDSNNIVQDYQGLLFAAPAGTNIGLVLKGYDIDNYYLLPSDTNVDGKIYLQAVDIFYNIRESNAFLTAFNEAFKNSIIEVVFPKTNKVPEYKTPSKEVVRFLLYTDATNGYKLIQYLDTNNYKHAINTQLGILGSTSVTKSVAGIGFEVSKDVIPFEVIKTDNDKLFNYSQAVDFMAKQANIDRKKVFAMNYDSAKSMPDLTYNIIEIRKYIEYVYDKYSNDILNVVMPKRTDKPNLYTYAIFVNEKDKDNFNKPNLGFEHYEVFDMLEHDIYGAYVVTEGIISKEQANVISPSGYIWFIKIHESLHKLAPKQQIDKIYINNTHAIITNVEEFKI